MISFFIFSLLFFFCLQNQPILYAFLSDNFKKSFLKAFTCTAGKDFNTQLQLENSFFPRFGKRSSEKFCSTTKTPIGGIIVTTHASNNNLNASPANENRQNPIATHRLSLNYKQTSDSNRSSQIDCRQLEFQSPKSDTISFYSLAERPPVLHTDL